MKLQDLGTVDPYSLSIEDRVELVRDSDGVLIEFLRGAVVEDLDLRDCTSLTHLPEGLEVGGDLDLEGCTSLTHLPEGLKVGGDLNLGGCTSLTSLPKGLKVEAYLYLGGCTSLTLLPEDLEVGGRIVGFKE